MGIFSKKPTKRQTDESRSLFGFSESMFRAFTGPRSPTVGVELLSIERIVVLRKQRMEVRYELEAVARFEKYTVPCEVMGVDGPLISSTEQVPPNIIEGWEHVVSGVVATANLDGRFLYPNSADLNYEEISPALTVRIPESFLRVLVRTHLRKQSHHAGFRLRPFGDFPDFESKVREDWSWTRFKKSVIDQGRSPALWTVFAASISTWEHRRFPLKPSP